MLLGVVALDEAAAAAAAAAAAVAALAVPAGTNTPLGVGEYRGGGVFEDVTTPLPLRRRAVVPWAVLQGIKGVPPLDEIQNICY